MTSKTTNKFSPEPICRVLPIAPSTYHDHAVRAADPDRLSARAKRDAILKVEVRRVFDENFGVYGVRTVWRQMRCKGFDVARCTISRLMQEMGLKGAVQGKTIRTTIPDTAASPPRPVLSMSRSSSTSSLDGSLVGACRVSPGPISS